MFEWFLSVLKEEIENKCIEKCCVLERKYLEKYHILDKKNYIENSGCVLLYFQRKIGKKNISVEAIQTFPYYF